MYRPEREFPPFSLSRLLTTVFRPRAGENLAILIDFDDPRQEMSECKFLQEPTAYPIQHIAHSVFYKPLVEGLSDELGLDQIGFFAYQKTYGSNRYLPDLCYDMQGVALNLEENIYPAYDIILAITSYSATAPLTVFCKEYGFRGATLHGTNETILRSGLAVDGEEASRHTEKLRRAMSPADAVEIDFTVAEHSATLRIELNGQNAQKAHGLCHEKADVVNLPTGEVYYVPTDANGAYPYKYEDSDTLAMMIVAGRHVVNARLITGDQSVIDRHLAKIKADPAVGDLGELGFGTQLLPFSGADIQDEKILGTFHIATGRSDHLGGDILPENFIYRENATHDDILFSPDKTPEIGSPQVRLYRNGETIVLMENYTPAEFIQALI
jgi:hypothetical protein